MIPRMQYRFARESRADPRQHEEGFLRGGCRRHQVLLLDRNRRLIGVEMAYRLGAMGQPGKGLRCLFKGGVPGADRAGDAGARWMLQRASGGRSASGCLRTRMARYPASIKFATKRGAIWRRWDRSSGIPLRISQPGQRTDAAGELQAGQKKVWKARASSSTRRRIPPDRVIHDE
jgi:hypothetical protein